MFFLYIIYIYLYFFFDVFFCVLICLVIGDLNIMRVLLLKFWKLFDLSSWFLQFVLLGGSQKLVGCTFLTAFDIRTITIMRIWSP